MTTHARKGQVFLADNEVLRRITDAATVQTNDLVVEIGMGRGQLTQHLVRRARKVVAVELDEAFIDAAAATFQSYSNLTIIHANILDVDWDELIPPGEKALVVGNVPYYITGPILRVLSEERRRIKRWALLLQKEVAERVCAAPGGKAYGALSVKSQVWGKPYFAFAVSARAFEPVPDVDSALVLYEYVVPTYAASIIGESFDKFVDLIFTSRRKKLANRLQALAQGRLSKPEITEILARVAAHPDARAEQLSPETVVQLYIAFGKFIPVL